MLWVYIYVCCCANARNTRQSTTISPSVYLPAHDVIVSVRQSRILINNSTFDNTVDGEEHQATDMKSAFVV